MRLTEDMKRVVAEQSLGFVATVRPDGTPAVSPKGTTRVRGDQLVFLHLHSPGTVANLAANPAVEVNVVDPVVRKGWRFAGRGRVLVSGPEFEEIIAWYDRPASAPPAQAVVVIDVDSAEELISPAYDSGATEAEIAAAWRERQLARRWPAHLRPGALRWVRSSTRYDDTVAFYRDLVGLPVVDSFQGSFGEDGTIFGLPDTAAHLEIVRSDVDAAVAGPFDQIVFYLADDRALARAIEPLLAAGATPVSAPHPYWAANGGVVFLDPDGRGVVYAPWIFGSRPDPGDVTGTCG
jgi:catechol 2,3-dioxygenase-like lactoylglutathione lyase family enzyme/predicted pyridoxine 5'-phosphate oxidase superfamily flavin-nucleotide-binding protein